MDNWFTIEKIDNQTFAISEYQHWEQTHCYLINGNKSSVLIDTGLGISNIKDIVCHLTNKPIEVMTTHTHWDHIGGHKYFDNISVHENEKKWLDGHFPIPLQVVKANLMKEPCNFPNDFNADSYTIYQGTPSSILHDNDIIDLGDRIIKILHTPGHSPGHICFYEEERGYLFTGDLVYKGKLDVFYPSTDPYDFMKSIKKIENLVVKRILPAHFSLNIDTTIIKRIGNAFFELYSTDKLKQGNGIFKFKDFSIHL